MPVRNRVSPENSFSFHHLVTSNHNHHDTPPTNLAIIIHPAWSIAVGLETELAVAVDLSRRHTVSHLVGDVRTRREITKPCWHNCRSDGQKSINAPR